MNTELLQRWRNFLVTDPIAHTNQTMESATSDALNCDWNSGPVEAFVPGVVEEFSAVSERLGILYSSNPDEWQKAWVATRPLFKAGCAFGEAIEKLEDVRIEGEGLDAEREAMDEARRVFEAIETLARDESSQDGT